MNAICIRRRKNRNNDMDTKQTPGQRNHIHRKPHRNNQVSVVEVNEKVLGFPKKNWIGLKFGYSPRGDTRIELENLEKWKVPVVSLEWLEKWCKENFIAEGYSFVWISELLSAAKKEAGK